MLFTAIAAVALAGAAMALPFSPAFAQEPPEEPPAAPTGLTADVFHHRVALTWNDPQDDSITGYQILRRNRAIHAPGKFIIHVQDTGTAGASYIDPDVEPETRYVYRIKARNAAGLSPRSSYAGADTPPSPAPARPSGLTSTATHDAVTLNWDDPDDDSITGYRILRRNRDTDDEGVFSVIAEDTGTTATGYTDRTVRAETRYTYRIKAINGHGASEQSGYTNADTPPAPAAPTGLAADPSHDSVTLSWADPGDDSITGYRILRGPDPGSLTTLVDDTGSAATEYVDSTVDAQTTYFYAVRVINAGGASEQSGTVETTTPAPPAPDPPTGLLTAATHKQVLLNWDDPGDDGITGYRVLRGPDADNLATLVDDTGSPATTYTDEDVEPETAYVYAVRAVNESGAGEASGSVSVTTQRAPEEQNTARQTTGVCDRTDAVENAIVAAVSGVTACGDVTSTHLENIAALDLFNKGITSLQSGDFDGLTGLTTLDLHINSLESLPADVFDGLTALTALGLNDNSLESLPADVFDGLTALTTLRLYDNSLESLPADVFDGLTALTTLNLHSNDLESLLVDVFDGLTALTTLNLDRNSLESLPADVFDSLTALTILNLYSNDLESLPADVFDGLTALTFLTLDNNTLTSLPEGVFEELTGLEGLYLQDNPGNADFIPTANAGADQLVELDATVTLDGSASSGGPWGTNVTYSWVKTSGADVTLDGADTTMPTFTAPGARDDLVFTLTVTGRGIDDDDDPYIHSAAVRVKVREDITPPSLQTATVNAASLALTYDEDLDTGSAPAASAYTVTVNGTTRNLAATSPVSIAGRTVTLTLASPVEYGDTVTLTYTVPDTNPVQDLEPNSAPGFTGQEVTNNTITAPGALANLRAVAGDSEVLLIWQAPESGGQVESYEYRYAQGSTVPPLTAWNDAGTTTRFLVTSLTNGRLHAFEVRARNNSANGPAASVTMTPEDLPLPVVSLSDEDQTIQEGPNVFLTVTATLSAPSTRQVTVQARSSPGTATPPLDFINLLDTMTFVPGATSQTRRVPITNDSIYEHDETFTVALSRPTNATVSDTQGTATITIEDDEPKPTARVSDASAQEGGEIEFTVRYALGNNCVNGVVSSVDWAVTIESGDTASADDLTLADSTLFFSSTTVAVGFLRHWSTLITAASSYGQRLFPQRNRPIAKVEITELAYVRL